MPKYKLVQEQQAMHWERLLSIYFDETTTTHLSIHDNTLLTSTELVGAKPINDKYLQNIFLTFNFVNAMHRHYIFRLDE